MLFRSYLVRPAGALPPVGAAQLTASFAITTNRVVVGSSTCGARSLRAKSTVALVVLFNAVIPALELYGRLIAVAPALVVIVDDPVESQLYSRGEAVSPAAASEAL